MGDVDGQNRYGYVRNRPVNAKDVTGLKLILTAHNSDADYEFFKEWLEQYSGIPLELQPRGADRVEVRYANCERSIGKGIGGRIVNVMLDEFDRPFQMLLRLMRHRTFDFDVFGTGNIDLSDFTALSRGRPPSASGLTQNEVLTHVLMENIEYSRNYGVSFDTAHARARWAAYTYRLENGQSGLPSLDGLRKIHRNVKVQEYDNGARIFLRSQGASFGAAWYEEP